MIIIIIIIYYIIIKKSLLFKILLLFLRFYPNLFLLLFSAEMARIASDKVHADFNGVIKYPLGISGLLYTHLGVLVECYKESS